MAENTSIEWCDDTFNIAWGCIEFGDDCKNCYARELSKRYGHDVWGPAKTTERRTFGDAHWREPLKWNEQAKREGRRRRVFCSSMADVGENHPTIARERLKLWPLIQATEWLDWLLLTKRTTTMHEWLPPDWGNGYRNVWLGASVGNQETLNERLPALLKTEAWVHFVSYGPAIGEADFTQVPVAGSRLVLNAFTGCSTFGYAPVDWIVAEGESGFNARPCNPDWLRKTRDDCHTFGKSFLLKQLGGHGVTKKAVGGGEYAVLDGRRHLGWPDSHPELPDAA